MRAKLTLRNAKRSIKDYLIYIVTMTVISSLMFAFNSLMFSKDLAVLYNQAATILVLVCIASFFIIIIVIWLVHYMVNFMMTKRSKEFGIYLLQGMKKEEIASMFRWENILLGLISLLIGIIPGILLQIAFINVFYSFMDVTYKVSLDLNYWTYLVTFALYIFAYVLALFRVSRKFKKMTISGLVNMDRQNESIQTNGSDHKALLTVVSVGYIVFFNFMMLTKNITTSNSMLLIGGLILAIYLLYIGLSSLLVKYINSKSKGIYHDSNIFVLRQLSAKVTTMRFTMATMTILFSTALFSWMLVMMFTDFQSNQLDNALPYDVQVVYYNTDVDFKEEYKVLNEQTTLEDSLVYMIYHNDSRVINAYLEEHVDGAYYDKEYNVGSYFEYDTYMKLSDYNYLRKMIGYETVTLSDDNYLVHCIDRVKSQMNDWTSSNSINIGGSSLTLDTMYHEPFSQKSINGADYLIVVDDSVVESLIPYYSALTAQIEERGTEELSLALKEFQPEAAWEELSDEEYNDINMAYEVRIGVGTDSVFSLNDAVVVKDYVKDQFIFIVVLLDFLLAYIGLVFLCVALTILAVQQLSDSTKFKYRYRVLKLLGVGKERMNKVVLKQLFVYYVCPFAISILVSLVIGMYGSERFVYSTGIDAQVFKYYFLAICVFTVVYVVYMLITFSSFMKNIQE